MQSAGVEFPPRVGNNLSWFTPPPTYPLSRSTSPYEDEVDVLALETDASGLRYCYNLDNWYFITHWSIEERFNH